MAHALYDRYPGLSEGHLSKIRAQAVSRVSCGVVARELGIGERLRRRGEELGGDDVEGLSSNRRVQGAVLEAVFGALVLEHGFDRIRDAVVAAFAARIDHAVTTPLDHTTTLMEALAKEGQKASYSVLEADGPPHDRTFTCAVSVDGAQVGSGEGRSKKAAEQIAAKQALDALGFETPALA